MSMPGQGSVGLPILTAAFLVGCAAYPPERTERDRAILAAIEPCKHKHGDFFDRVYVDQEGRLGGLYKEHMVGRYEDVERCIGESLKDMRAGPWAAGQLAKGGPATVSVTRAGREILVPVLVNQVPGMLALHARSGFTHLRSAYAKRAGLEVGFSSPSTHARDGDKNIVVPFVRAKSLQVGDAVVEALDIVVYDAPSDPERSDGALGGNFLSHFKMSIDDRNNRLILEPLRPSVSMAPR